MPKFEGAPIPPPEEPEGEKVPTSPDAVKKPEEILDLPEKTVEEFEKRNEEEAEQTAEAISQLEEDPQKRKEAKSKIKRLALTLGLAGFVAGSAFFLTREKEVAEAEEAEIRSVEYEAERERAREILSEKLGMDLVESAERHGFTVHLKVDNGDGDYVVHIGQTHGMGGAVLPETRESQKAIYGLLEEASRGISERLVLFSEDMTEEAMPGLETLKELYQKTRSMPRAEEIHKATGLPTALEDSMSARGAGLDLFMRDRIDIMPTTQDISGTIERREALRAERQKIREAITMLKIDHDWGKISEQEFQKRQEGLVQSMDSNSKALIQISFDERENYAVESISNYQTRNGVYFMKFGDAHDFSEAIEAHNEKNPDKKLGLIKFQCPTGSDISKETLEEIYNQWKYRD